MSHIYLCLSNSSIVIYVMNTEREVIPEAAQASAYPCQVPHYIYLSAITQTQAQFILNTLSASAVFSFKFIHKIQITNCLYLSVTSPYQYFFTVFFFLRFIHPSVDNLYKT